MIKKIAAGLIAAGVILGIGTPAMATGTEHCPEPYSYKVEGNNNTLVLDEGTLFCVKASNEVTGVVLSDGEHDLSWYVKQAGITNWKGQPHDVSHYVVYQNNVPGPEGPPGEPGPEGPQGPKGDKGDRGPRGWPGKPGKNGTDGLTPVAVCTGNPGGIYFVTEEPEVLPEEHFYPNAEFPCYGPAGEDGVDGVDGKDGVDGVNGTDGKDGLNGTNGVDGPAGPQGLTGPAGQVTEVTAPVTEAPVTPPVTELPRTGASWTLILAGIGILAGGLGLAFRVLGRNTV